MNYPGDTRRLGRTEQGKRGLNRLVEGDPFVIKAHPVSGVEAKCSLETSCQSTTVVEVERNRRYFFTEWIRPVRMSG